MAGANSNIQVTDLDFNNIKNNLKTYLQSQDTLKDYNYEGSALSTLLDVLSYNTQYNAYYLNMVANEMFLDSALQRSSVVSHAKMLGYTPKSVTAPQASIQLTMNQVNTSTLTLPKYTEFLSEAIDGVNYTFVTTEDTTVHVNANTAVFTDVTIKQGNPTNFSYTVDLSSNPNCVFEIPDTNVDTSTLLVSVQTSSTDSTSDRYTLSTSVLKATADSKIFFIQENSTGKYQIQFGNGVIGKQLVNGNIVRMSYLVTSGTSAYGANSFVLMGTVNNFANNVVTPLTSATNGAEKESITSIKFQAPKSYYSQGRAVTKEDYVTILQQNNLGITFDSVNVWGGEQNDPPVYGQVFICAKPSGSYNLTQTQKQRLIDDVIKPISVMTVEPVLIDPDYTYLQLSVDVLYDTKKTNLSASQLTTAIKSAIQTYADSTLNSFNSTFSSTDFNRVIKLVDGSITTSDISVRVQKKLYPKLTVATTYKLIFGTSLERGMFQSGITSTPSMNFVDPVNTALVIDSIYLEELPSSTGGIQAINITNPGYGYQLAPKVEILGDGKGATATAIISANGRLKTIEVTNAGSGYTSALVKITPQSQDTTGQQGAASAVLEGRYGTLRSFYNNADYVKTIFSESVGTVDYAQGIVTLNSLNPVQVNNDLGQLTISAKPTSTIISSTYNRIITVDPYDPNAIIVNLIAKT